MQEGRKVKMIKYEMKNDRLKIETQINNFILKYCDDTELVNNELNKLIDYIRDEAIINE